MSVAAVQVTVILGHRAWYRKKATVGKTHDWILFVRGTDGNDISHFVEKIVYNLHESFSPPRRVRDKPPYELHESGYGEFYPTIDIYFKNKGEKGVQRKVSLQYFLNLNHRDAPPVNTSRFEKINFHHPSEEFLEKVLKSGGVILDEDGVPTNSKSRLSSSNLHHGHESKLHETIIADADFPLKSSSHKDKKLKRPSEVNPMSNESVSSNDSLNSRLSSKSDCSEKEADALSRKRMFKAMLFDVSDEDVQKKKKKTTEKPDPGKSRTTSEPKAPPGKSDTNVEKKHRLNADDGQRHSSGKSHRESGTAKHHDQHQSHSSSGGSGKQKGGGSSSPRSASRTPQKTPTKNTDKAAKPSESRSHAGSSSHGGGSSGHNNGSSSTSNPAGNPKSGASKGSGGGSSYHGDQFPKADSQHRSSSKQRDSDRKLDGMAKKLTSDVQVRLSPMDVKFSSPEMNSRSTGSHRSPEAGGNKSVHLQDLVVSNGKSSQMSPLKYPPKTAQLSSPNNSSDGKGFDGVGQVTAAPSGARNPPNFVAILKQLASEEDEEEDGEIRSPRVIEPSDLGNWSKNGDKRSNKHRDGIASSDRKKPSKSSSHPEKISSEASRTSPKKQKSVNSSSDKTSVVAVADKGGSSSTHRGSGHGKTAKKLHAKENFTSDASVPSRASDTRPREQNDSSERKTETPAKHRSQRVERVPSVERSSLPTGRDDDRDNPFADLLSDALYDKRTDAVLPVKEESPCVFSHPDRAPNGELLTSLVAMKQRLGDMMNCQLLSQIADVIEASGKFKVDEENFEFDLCALDAETVRKVKELMDSE